MSVTFVSSVVHAVQKQEVSAQRKIRTPRIFGNVPTLILRQHDGIGDGTTMSDEMKYIKLYLDEIAMWQEVLSIEEIGYLLVATASYMTDGTIMEVPSNVRFAFSDQRRKVDMRKAVYKSKVENGHNGGITKAENAEIQKSTGFKPPSKKQFKDTVLQLVENNEIFEGNFSTKDINQFFTQLRNDRWTVRGTPIKSDADLALVLRAKFYIAPYEPKRSLFFPAFESAFSSFPDLRDDKNNSLAEDAVSDFFDIYDKSSNVFVVNGRRYQQSKWENALHSFIKQWVPSES